MSIAIGDKVPLDKLYESYQIETGGPKELLYE